MSSIITEPTTAHEFTCPPWCISASEPDHVDAERGSGASVLHFSESEEVYTDHGFGGRGGVYLHVYSEEALNADGSNTATRPLVMLQIDREAFLTAEELLDLRDIIDRFVEKLDRITEQGESL